jgi:Domain of Unknown Function (DUF350).
LLIVINDLILRRYIIMSLLNGVGLSVIYGILGSILLFAVVACIDKIIKRIDFIEELLKDNRAVGIVIGFFILGISIIIASAIS